MRAYLSSVKRAPQALLSHWPFTEQQRGEGQEKIDALTELCSQFFFLVTVFPLCCTTDISPAFKLGGTVIYNRTYLHITFY